MNTARLEFEKTIKRGSEPDIIVKTDKALFFIEAKLTSGNNTQPYNFEDSQEKYTNCGNKWYSNVFKLDSDYKTVVKMEKKYELMRFWLLGTWLANKLGLDFYIINLVLAEKEKDIETAFKKHIKENYS